VQQGSVSLGDAAVPFDRWRQPWDGFVTAADCTVHPVSVQYLMPRTVSPPTS
jgi:hypothetical protein